MIFYILLFLIAFIAMITIAVQIKRLLYLRRVVHYCWRKTLVQLNRRQALVKSLSSLLRHFLSDDRKLISILQQQQYLCSKATDTHTREQLEQIFYQHLKRAFKQFNRYPEMLNHRDYLTLLRQWEQFEDETQLAIEDYNGFANLLLEKSRSIWGGFLCRRLNIVPPPPFQLDSLLTTLQSTTPTASFRMG